MYLHIIHLLAKRNEIINVTNKGYEKKRIKYYQGPQIGVIKYMAIIINDKGITIYS